MTAPPLNAAAVPRELTYFAPASFSIAFAVWMTDAQNLESSLGLLDMLAPTNGNGPSFLGPLVWISLHSLDTRLFRVAPLFLHHVSDYNLAGVASREGRA